MNKNNEAIARVVLLSGEPGNLLRFESHFAGNAKLDAGTVLVPGLSAFSEEILYVLSQVNNPLVVVLGDDISHSDALKIGAQIGQVRPDSSVVLTSGKKADIAAAMRAGIRAVLDAKASSQEVIALVEEMAQEARARWESVVISTANSQRVDTRGSIIAIVSPKGGVGKTTVSTNIAVGLAKKSPNQVVLVDLDVQFGDVSSALALVPTHTILDIVKGPAKSDLLVLKSFITEHESGLRVIPAPFAPEESSQITSEEITNLLNTLRDEFEYVVVDTAPGFSELTLSALELASDTVVVSELDVPSLRGVRKALDVLQALNLVGNKQRIVINNLGRDSGITLADAKALIVEPISGVISSSSKVSYSTNEGIPLLLRTSRGRVANQFQKIVDGLTHRSRPGAYTPNDGVVA